MKLGALRLLMEPVALAYEFASSPSTRGLALPTADQPVLRLPSAYADVFRANWDAYTPDQRRALLAALSRRKLAFFPPDLLYDAEQADFVAREVGTTPSVLLAEYTVGSLDHLAALFALAKVDAADVPDLEPADAAIVVRFRDQVGGRVPTLVARLLTAFAPDDYARLRSVSRGFSDLTLADANVAQLVAAAYPALGFAARVGDAFPFLESSATDRALRVQQAAVERLAADQTERQGILLAADPLKAERLELLTRRIADVTKVVNRFRQREKLTTESLPTIDRLMLNFRNRQAELVMRMFNAIFTHPNTVGMFNTVIGQLRGQGRHDGPSIKLMDAASIQAQRYDGRILPPLFRPRNPYPYLFQTAVNPRGDEKQPRAFVHFPLYDRTVGAGRLPLHAGRLFNGVPTLQGRYLVWAPRADGSVHIHSWWPFRRPPVVWDTPEQPPLRFARNETNLEHPVILYNEVLIDGNRYHRFETYIVEYPLEVVPADLPEYAAFNAAQLADDEEAAQSAFLAWEAAANALPRFAQRIVQATVSLAIRAADDATPQSIQETLRLLEVLRRETRLQACLALVPADAALDDALQRTVNKIQPLTFADPAVRNATYRNWPPAWGSVNALLVGDSDESVAFNRRLAGAVSETFLRTVGSESAWIAAGAPGRFTRLDYLFLKYLYVAAVATRLSGDAETMDEPFFPRLNVNVDRTAGSIGTGLNGLYVELTRQMQAEVTRTLLPESVRVSESPDEVAHLANELARLSVETRKRTANA